MGNEWNEYKTWKDYIWKREWHGNGTTLIIPMTMWFIKIQNAYYYSMVPFLFSWLSCFPFPPSQYFDLQIMILSDFFSFSILFFSILFLGPTLVLVIKKNFHFVWKWWTKFDFPFLESASSLIILLNSQFTLNQTEFLFFCLKIFSFLFSFPNQTMIWFYRIIFIQYTLELTMPFDLGIGEYCSKYEKKDEENNRFDKFKIKKKPKNEINHRTNIRNW